MITLRTLIVNYENDFKNDLSEIIIQKFNENQAKAFQIVLNNKDLEDDALNNKIAQELYGCGPTHSTYKSFKNTFTQALLKVVFLHKSKGSVLRKTVFELQEELLIINKLITMGLRSVAKDLCDKVLKKAMKFHQYEVARSLLQIIIGDHVFYGTEKKQGDAIAKYEKINNICVKEMDIKIIYGELTKLNNISNAIKNKYYMLINDIYSQLEFDSFLFHYYFYSIRLILCEDEEYENECNKAISYFSNLWFNHKTYLSIFRNRLLKYKISKDDFVKSMHVLNVLMEDHREFTYHWYLYALTYVRVLLYAGDVSEAFKWYQKIVESRNYITLPKDHRNEWEVLGMYVYLMKDDTDRISIRKVKYNLNYNRTERSKNNLNFLIAEIIYDIKCGKIDIDKKVKHLEKLSKKNPRVQAFCATLLNGRKYNPKSKPSFDDEIVQFERLVALV